jgi:hypothetical protein
LWLVEYRRRKALDNRPALFAPSAVEGMAFFGRWLAGVSGIGVALSISAMFSSYTSLASVDAEHICVASQFVSRTMREGRATALDFITTGFLALIAASIPRAAWVSRNIKLHDLLREDTKPVRFSQWASSYSETKVVILCFVGQIIPLLIAVPFFRTGLDHAFGPHLLLSAEAIQSIWQGFKTACAH